MTHTDLLNRIRSKRIMYGDFAPWEMDDDDPRQSEFKENPTQDTLHEISLPLEKRDAQYLMEDYLPKKFNVSRSQVVNMAARYMDHKGLIRGYHDYLTENYPYHIQGLPKPVSTTHLVSMIRKNAVDDRYILRNMAEYLNTAKYDEDAHTHLVHDAKIAQVTGKI